MFRNVIIQYCRNHSNNPRCAQPFVSFRKTREQRQNIYNMYVCDLLPVFVISQGVFPGVGGGTRCVVSCSLLLLVEVAEIALLRLRRGFIPLEYCRLSSSCSVKWPAHWSKVVEVSLPWGWCAVTCSELVVMVGGEDVVCAYVCWGRYLGCSG